MLKRFESFVKIKVNKMAIGKMAQTLIKGKASAPEEGAVITKASLAALSML